MEPLILTVPKLKFPLGQTVITANAQATLNPDDVRHGLERHASGDWGELCPEDALSNADALKHGGRLMSVYGQGKTRFWIITECDRSVTTVLMPIDY